VTGSGSKQLFMKTAKKVDTTQYVIIFALDINANTLPS